MKTTPSSMCALVLLLAAGLPVAALADQTLAGTVTVEENLIVNGTVEVGEATLGSSLYPAYALVANSAVGVTIVDQIATGNSTTWNWIAKKGSTDRVVMKLEDSGKLSLYGSRSSTPKIVINEYGFEIDGVNLVSQMAGSIALGNVSRTSANSVVIGENAYAGSNGGVAIGTGASVEEGVAIGVGAAAFGSNSIAIGNGAFIENYSDDNSLSIGYNSKAYGCYAVVVGAGAVGSSDSVVVGVDSSANSSSTALGCQSKAIGQYSTALGYSSKASGEVSVALGSGSVASGYYSVASGYYSKASGSYSTVFGPFSSALGYNSIALGRGLQAEYENQFALGYFNKAEEDAAFMLGNGIGSSVANRSNLFVIKKDGRGVFRSTSYVEPTEENLAPEQPEALTVEGSATIKGATTIDGTLTLKRRQGNIGMGSFGRAEDQSPGN